jgi:periplasmic copper chaperone A
MSLSHPLRACLLLVGALVLSAAARAEDYRAGDIRVEHPWARATAGNARIGAAYLTLDDVGSTPDRLVAIETPVAGAAELHAEMLDGNVMQMRPVGAIEIHPGTPTVLQPGGLHIMLMDLKDALKAGESFPLTLVFERAGRLQISVPVERAGARGPGDAMPMNHPMPMPKGS